METGAAIIESAGLILVEVAHEGFEQARDDLASVAELVKSPDAVYTYRLTPLSVWNAAALGLSADDILARLARHARFGVPPQVATDVREWSARYGQLVILPGATPDRIELRAVDPMLLERLRQEPLLAQLLLPGPGAGCAQVRVGDRGHLKQALVHAGFPPRDRAGYAGFAPLPCRLKDESVLRPYQRAALEAFFAHGDEGGSGVVCMPCGAGKTLLGIAAIARLGAEALVITSGTVAARQWIREALERTTLRREQVGEYTGTKKEVRPLTVTTYSLLATRPRNSAPRREDEMPPHLALLSRAGFGIVIYDEVHLLPAPVFRATAQIQAKRRLGLTATLIREDGREEDVFALVGPKRAEVGWKALEAQHFLAAARCIEMRVPLAPALRERYALASRGEGFRLAATNPRKDEVALELLAEHRGDRVLVIGTYLDQLERIARTAALPLITGATSEADRDRLYTAFRAGELSALVVSKVANFAIDLPDASVAIEVSGTYGSRQEEAQRLGRILRPKSDGRGAVLYALVSRDTMEEDTASRRQRFLLEHGYRYEVRAREDEERAPPLIDVAGDLHA